MMSISRMCEKSIGGLFSFVSFSSLAEHAGHGGVGDLSRQRRTSKRSLLRRSSRGALTRMILFVERVTVSIINFFPVLYWLVVPYCPN